MFGLGRDKELVGVDIGSYSIKAVELKAKKKEGETQYDVKKIGYELLPHDAIVEGTIIDSAAVVETIKMVFDENKITNKKRGHFDIWELRNHQENRTPFHGIRRTGRIHNLGSEA